MDSWYWQRLMVWTWTYGIDNTHGIELNLWYSIDTPESHTYKCCLYAGFFFSNLDYYFFLLNCVKMLLWSGFTRMDKSIEIFHKNHCLQHLPDTIFLVKVIGQWIFGDQGRGTIRDISLTHFHVQPSTIFFFFTFFHIAITFEAIMHFEEKKILLRM